MAIDSRGDEMTRYQRLLVRITAALIVFGIGPPVIELLLMPLLRTTPSVGSLLSLPLAVWGFLDYALGKVLCAILAICALLVVVSTGIGWWIKVGLAASAGIACFVILHWAERLSHEW